MTISAKNVQQLRQMTGAGMMACKKALTEADNDLDKAVDILRKKGAASAQNKASRSAQEGRICIALSEDRKKACACIVSCETDFVAKGELFAEFARNVATSVLCKEQSQQGEIIESLETKRTELVGHIGENVQIGERVLFETTNGHLCASYSHGLKIGTIVQYSGADDISREVAMQIAAMRPSYISIKDVPQAIIDKEREVAKEQSDLSNKPPKIVEKIINGRVDKTLDEICLYGQSFIKDPSIKIAQLLKNNQTDIFRFARFEIGAKSTHAKAT